MDNGQFEHLLREIAESRRRTGEMGLELRHRTAEMIAESREHAEAIADESRRHFDVVAESLHQHVRLLAEGFVRVDGKIDRLGETLRSELAAESAETRAMIKLSYAELDRRLSTLEARS